MICDECETVAHCMKNGCVPKTTKKDEALKLALDALEQLQGGCTDHDDGTVEAITVWCPEVIDAIREALAEPSEALASEAIEQPSGVATIAPVAEPRKQEPVAKVDYKQRDGFRWLNYLGWQRIPDGASLYISPPTLSLAQRKPLTDEEIMKVWQPVAKKIFRISGEGHSADVFGIKNESMVLSLSRAIEAAHGIKEKNSD